MAMTDTARKLLAWRAGRSNGEAARLLGLPMPTFKKYIYGEREPSELAKAELVRRMEATKHVETTPNPKVAAPAPGR
jgi:predicted transcriptional regulator